MFTHNRSLIILSITISTGLVCSPVVAQDDQTARSSAALPKIIEQTTELVPTSPQIGEDTDNPNAIGRVATSEEIAAIDIDIMPDGGGLPEGSGNYEAGALVYADQCLACHGEALEGNSDIGAPRLIGGRDSLATDSPVKTVESYWPYASTLFDYVHRAMPLNAPGSLTPDETYAVTAYILGEAGIVEKSTTLDATNYGEIVMPNAGGFIPDPRGDGY